MLIDTDLPHQPDTLRQSPNRSFKPLIWKAIFILLLIVNLIFGCWAFWLMYSVSLHNITAAGMAIVGVISYFFILAPIDLIAVLFYLRPQGTARVIISTSLVLVSLPLFYYIVSIVIQLAYIIFKAGLNFNIKFTH